MNAKDQNIIQDQINERRSDCPECGGMIPDETTPFWMYEERYICECDLGNVLEQYTHDQDREA